MTTDTIPDAAVIVFSKPNCVQCTATYRALDKHGIAYKVVDLTQDPAALEELKSLGHQQAPVVKAGKEHWGGFRPDKIKAIAPALNPAGGAS